MIAGLLMASGGSADAAPGSPSRTQQNSPPSTPTDVKVAFPSLPCATTGPVPLANNHAQSIALQATVADPDGNNLSTRFQIVKSGDPNAVYFALSTGFQAPGVQTISVPRDTLPEDVPLSWHAYTSDGHATSGWSAWCHLKIDNVAPAKPTVSTTDFGSLTEGAKGNVGTPGEVTLTGDSQTVMLRWSPNGLPVPSADDPPVCGATVGHVTTVCVTAGQPATITLVPMESHPSLYVDAFDSAGNRSLSAQETFWVHSVDLREPGHHFWQTEDITGAPAAVADDELADPAAPLQLSATGSGWTSAGPDRDLQVGGPSLTFDGSGSAQAATQLPFDASHSVTMMAWVYPTSGGVTQTFLSEDGANISAFSLLLGRQNEWKMCLPTTSQASWQIECATGPVAQLNHWSFVVGIWNAAAQRIYLYVNDPNDPTTVQQVGSVPHTMVAPAAGDVVVARGKVGGPTMRWHGHVNNPVIYPGVLATSQLQFLLLSSQGPCSADC